MTPKQRHRFRPVVDQLEARALPASVKARLVDGILTIVGTSRSDTVSIQQGGGKVSVLGLRISVDGRRLARLPVAAVTAIHVLAGNGNDTISVSPRVTLPVSMDGGPGADWLAGGSGADSLAGGPGKDTLLGGAGNDLLSGDGGADSLVGGPGDDRLYGGLSGDRDRMRGGLGNDRFLAGPEDTVLDLTPEDARIRFLSGSTSWTDDEVERVDAAFQVLQDRTHNTRLLRQPDGRDLIFRRDSVSPQGPTLLGQNAGSRGITFFNSAFTSVTNPLSASVWHEIGHNWESPSGLGVAGYEAFLALSGWTPCSQVASAGACGPSPGKNLSLDGRWQYDQSARFVRSYGRTNPEEDWATLWEVALRPDLSAATVAGLPYRAKLDVVNALLDRLTG
jgi:hypothetical protein